jgi:hypothetical protein
MHELQEFNRQDDLYCSGNLPEAEYKQLEEFMEEAGFGAVCTTQIELEDVTYEDADIPRSA